MQPRWLSKSHDHGTSAEHSEHTTTATTTSACSECSDLKEKLGDVTRRLEAQEVQMDTLRQLMESLRSGTLIVPPEQPPPPSMQTSTPLGSPASIYRAPSPAACSPDVPPADHGPDPTPPAVPSMESPPHAPASSLPDASTTIPMHVQSIAPDLLNTLWGPTAVEDTHSPRSPSPAGDDHVPPSHPPPFIISTDDAMAVDEARDSVPTITVSPVDSPLLCYLHPL